MATAADFGSLKLNSSVSAKPPLVFECRSVILVDREGRRFAPGKVVMLGIPVGLAVANITEWVVHKYVLHGLGKDKKSFWSFHWHDHHKNARTQEHRDPDYEGSVFRWNGQGKEALALSLSGLAYLPLFPVAPFFVGTLLYSGINYYRKHKRSHLDPEWAREHLPWHYDHHMGPNQHANWCVTRPWFDVVMGTREPYVGTKKELADQQRQAKRAARRAAIVANSNQDSGSRGGESIPLGATSR